MDELPPAVIDKRRPLERARTASVLGRLVYTGRANPGEHRVRLTDLTIKIAAEHFKLSGDAFSNALSGTDWPGPENVWYWGEALRDLGIPWISGLWLLWALGHHKDAMGVTLHWIAAHVQEADMSKGNAIDNLWQGFVTTHWLIDSTDVDSSPDFAARLVRAPALSEESHEAIWRHVAKLPNFGDQSLAYTSFVQHELAKKPWIIINERKNEFREAFDAWFTAGRMYEEPRPLVALGRTLLAVGTSDLELQDRETVALMVLEQWLTSLEHGGRLIFNRGFDGSLISLLPSKFDDDPRSLRTQADMAAEYGEQE